MSTTEMTTRDTSVSTDLQEKVLLGGDLSKLTPTERLSYYSAVCASVGLNPLTRPFEYLVLNDKMVLYARKDCTDQLRDLHGISVQIVGREVVDGVYVVTAQGKNMTERTDESIGAVPLVKESGEWMTAQSGKRYFKGDGTYKPLGPDEKANAMMKAETKAKRRVTLSICGLGILDETEIETIPGAKVVVDGEAKSVPLGKTFAEKFPEQALAIQEKLQAVPPSQPEPTPPEGSHATSGTLSIRQGDGADGPQPGASPASVRDAPAPTDDPATPYRAKIKTAHDEKECNKAYADTPEPLKQDVHGDYFDKLKELSKRNVKK